MTLYVCLCGYEPFFGENDKELKDANRAAIVDLPEEDWKHVSLEARDLVLQMMQADPSKRINAKQALSHSWFSIYLGESEGQRQRTASSCTVRDDACSVS